MRACNKGFTLIELSIVLVIIGLIIGGILVGQDLIKTAEVRAQISQIEKYNVATQTFRGKFGALPGDISAAAANQFGFGARGSSTGQGDGNGVLQDCNGNGSAISCGELTSFWIDLSSAAAGNLVDGTFATASITTPPPSPVAASLVNLYFPAAKITGNSLYITSGGVGDGNGKNYFSLSSITQLQSAISTPILTVRQAYNMDKKTDDGMPQSGNTLAMYKSTCCGVIWVGTADTSATPQTTSTCYDNGGSAGAGQQYSMGTVANYGGNGNCALSFKFQ